MKNQPYATIELYLRRLMPPEEQRAFESEIATNPELAAEVAFYETLLLHHDQKLKTTWRAKGEAMLDTPLEVHIPAANRTRWAAAAALALLLTATGIWYTAFYNPYRSVVAQYAEPYRYSGNLGNSAAGNEDVQWQKTLEAYRAGEYKKAVEAATPLLQSARYADEARLLTGIASLERGKPEEALRALEAVQTPMLRAKAQFYTALAYLEAKNVEKAKSTLNAIAPDSPYRKKADEVMIRLEK